MKARASGLWSFIKLGSRLGETMKRARVWGSVALAAIALCIGIGLLILFRLLGLELGDGTFIALLILPLLVIAVGMGFLQEFSGPGGWGAKFREIANTKVEPEQIVAEQMQELQVVEKMGTDRLPFLAQSIGTERPAAIKLYLGRRSYYGAEAISQYIKALSSVNPDLYVLIVDEADKFIAMASGESLLKLLRTTPDVKSFMDALSNGDRGFFDSSFVFQTQTVDIDLSNRDVLAIMQKTNCDAIAVVDSDRVVRGTVRRDQIVAKLLLTLAKDSA